MILITGGAEFLGSHLAERLLVLGHDVLVLDELSTGQMAAYRIGSVTDRPLVAELVAQHHRTPVCRGRGSPHHRAASPHDRDQRAWAEIVLGCAAKKEKRVIVTSISEVYGNGTKAPSPEAAGDLKLGGDAPFTLGLRVLESPR